MSLFSTQNFLAIIRVHFFSANDTKAQLLVCVEIILKRVSLCLRWNFLGSASVMSGCNNSTGSISGSHFVEKRESENVVCNWDVCACTRFDHLFQSTSCEQQL